MRRGERARPAAERVIVIGGGAAGLAAAARLGPRAGVVLVEARDRLGGRIDTRADPALGIALDHGAEFVHGRLPRTLALARRAGARVREVPDRHARRDGAQLADGAAAFSSAEELVALGLRDDEPFEALLSEVRRGGRRSTADAEQARELVRGFYLADPRTASSLALSRMTRGLEQAGGDATYRVDGGYARALEPLRRALRRAGSTVRLSTAVEEVRWRPGGVEVLARGPAGGRLAPIAGERLVVTVPVSILRDESVRFSPPIPEKLRAASALDTGPLVKVLLRFRRPAWAESGPGALAFLHVPGAAFPVFWTLAPIRAPILVGWAGGPDAAALAGRRPQEVVRAALDSAAHGLGRAVRELEDALDGADVADWTHDPFARGGYAVFPVGSAGAADALGRSVEDTLFFAGEATAGELAGTVEGAIRTGERAAAEVLAATTTARHPRLASRASPAPSPGAAEPRWGAAPPSVPR